MSRITACLSALKKAQKKALIPYIVCGDPDITHTLAIMHALVAGGADVLELGVPFSDPMAEGSVIQLAHERALAQRMNLENIFTCVKQFRKEDSKTPLVLMGYTNPIEKMGYEKFAQAAQQADIDGVLTVDLPYEEAVEYNHYLKKHHIDSIFLLTPTTTEVRAKNICQLASGYLYYVSLKGVTGAGHLDIADVQKNYQRLSTYTDLPICVGFGIKDAVSAENIASFASGVVIGSALIHGLLDAYNQEKDLAQFAKQWLQKIRNAMDVCA